MTVFIYIKSHISCDFSSNNYDIHVAVENQSNMPLMKDDK